MTDTDTDTDMAPERLDRARRIALAIGFVLVVIGMLNNLPVFPGLEDGLRSLTGSTGCGSAGSRISICSRLRWF